MIEEVYFDNSATTKPRQEVIDAMMLPLTEIYGNPSSLHKKGVDAENLVKQAKFDVGALINCSSDEIIFTSGGTESNNIAIRGVCYCNRNRGKHIITTKFEHASVLNTFKALEKDGFEVTYLDISNDGFISLEQLENCIREDTIFISIMYVNSEVGTIQPVKEASAIIKMKAPNAYFHVDAVQAFCKFHIDVKKLNIDLMSVSSHKIHGPKGVGALFIKKGTKINSVYTGGPQEYEYRPGTENVPGIVGFGKACEIEHDLMNKDNHKIKRLRQELEEGILANIPDTQLNGNIEHRAPHICSISFLGVKGEVLVHALEAEKIYASTGSACVSHAHKKSHVLEAMGLKEEAMEGTIRFSLSSLNSHEQVNYCIEKLKSIVEELRKYKRR